MTMKKTSALLIVCLVCSSMIAGRSMADVEPLIGATLFGGAERGPSGKEVKVTPTCNPGPPPVATNCDTHRVLGDVIGLGGFELLGVLPLAQRFGLQGSFAFTGEEDGYRLSTSLGPIYAYDSGKVGLFVDYQYRKEPLADIRPDSDPAGDIEFLSKRRYQDFIFLRGVWAHYFEKFDLLLSYTQPLEWKEKSSAVGWDPRRTLVGQRACFAKDVYTINELKGVARIYPITQLEVDIGMLVNSFAGPYRNVTGTGVGGVFGLHYGITKNLILNVVQAQGDSRERFRATSGIQFFWSPASDKKPKRDDMRTETEAMLLSAAGSGATHGSCL